MLAHSSVLAVNIRGTISRLANLRTRSRCSSTNRNTVHAAAAPGREKLPGAELLHDAYLALRNGSEHVVAETGPSARFGAVAVAAQVARDHGEVLRASRGDFVPGRLRQRIPTQEQEPWELV